MIVIINIGIGRCNSTTFSTLWKTFSKEIFFRNPNNSASGAFEEFLWKTFMENFLRRNILQKNKQLRLRFFWKISLKNFLWKTFSEEIFFRKVNSSVSGYFEKFLWKTFSEKLLSRNNKKNSTSSSFVCFPLFFFFPGSILWTRQMITLSTEGCS